MSYNIQTNLEGCIKSLAISNGIMDSSLELLSNSTDDFPRLCKILKQNKVFTTVPELDIKIATKNLNKNLMPQINSLIIKIEAELVKLEKNKQKLLDKCELQQTRLENFNKIHNNLSNKENFILNNDEMNSSEEDIIGTEEELQKLKFLKGKKERLKYSLSRLNLQENKKRLSIIPSNI
ncbi:hypothetical protein PACTADRAFT_31367 [Pachysolen tannophilus NRRL Y-2460]|uniref:DASH complex subunit SPC19 n=1 Tax=Pachysolen tannophilus NRRL Y-2460 TaxID=669874 RepID=A0A1E4U1R6_PACTA|nr:hypothetical protein PACTADRAFT_31367 [Pachysolen tannophilus NRRL Y-2460]